MFAIGISMLLFDGSDYSMSMVVFQQLEPLDDVIDLCLTASGHGHNTNVQYTSVLKQSQSV